jgi:outer membrane receptor protein involved in Fe transport
MTVGVTNQDESANWRFVIPRGAEASRGILTPQLLAEAKALLAFDEISEEARRYESRHYFDLATSFRLKRGFELTFGVNNLTDAKPALTGFNQVQANTDPSLYDVLGRRYFVSLQASSK